MTFAEYTEWLRSTFTREIVMSHGAVVRRTTPYHLWSQGLGYAWALIGFTAPAHNCDIYPVSWYANLLGWLARERLPTPKFPCVCSGVGDIVSTPCPVCGPWTIQAGVSPSPPRKQDYDE